jgi:hypothetical protein
MGEDRQPTPDEQVRQLFGEAEKRTASAVEALVHGDSFGEILARATENVMGVTRIGFDALDLVVRNLRIAGRTDLIRLGRQLARNEDKLERVLQEVERLQEQVRELERQPSSTRTASSSSGGGSSSRRRASTRSSNGRPRTGNGGSRSSSGGSRSSSGGSRSKSSG